MAKFDIARCQAILAKYGGCWDVFFKLRGSSYEKALAGSSLDLLEQLYAELANPAHKTFEACSQSCPPWPKGRRYKGRPSKHVLCKIAGRLRIDSVMNKLYRACQGNQAAGEEFKKLFGGRHTEVVDKFITVLGEEMGKDAVRGMRVGEMLKPLDRLLVKERMDRETSMQAEKLRRADRSLEIKSEQIALAQSKLELELQKYRDKEAARKKALEEATAGRTPDGSVPREVFDRFAEELKLI